MRWSIVAVAALGVVLVVAVVIAAVVSLPGTDGAESAGEPPPARHSSRTAPGVNWVAEANAVCRLGRKLYPNIVLGATGDPDTIHYAINRLVTEIGAIATLTPNSSGHELDLQGRPQFRLGTRSRPGPRSPSRRAINRKPHAPPLGMWTGSSLWAPRRVRRFGCARPEPCTGRGVSVGRAKVPSPRCGSTPAIAPRRE